MSDTITLVGESLLRPALLRAAARAGAYFTVKTGEQPPVVRRCGSHGTGSPPIMLVPDDDLPRAICTHMLSSLVRSLEPAPAAVEGTVLAPASGVCGASFAGPVNAIRHDGLIRDEVDDTPCRVRMLRVQQTRCWLLAASLRPAGEGSPRLVLGPVVRQTAAPVGTDTARAAQYMEDLGLGSDWPGLLFLDGLDHDQDGTVRVLVAFTDADYATAIVNRVLGDAGGPPRGADGGRVAR